MEMVYMNRGIRVSNMVMVVAAITVATCLVWGASAGNISIYWGQNGEASLNETCATGNFGFVMLSFLTNISGTPVLNLSNHCNSSSGGCQKLSSEIEFCQQNNIKVFLSMRGNYSITSAEDAQLLADHLFVHYFGGTSDSRPLGDAVLDGLDFDIQGTTEYLDDFAKSVSTLVYWGKGKVYLSAAPQCPYPDPYLGPALQTDLFDYVWIKFYNNPSCEYSSSDPDSLVQAWNNWTSSVPTTQNQSFFLGLPASPDAASSGFIPAETLTSSVLPQIDSSLKYGGVMLWNKYYDEKTYYSSSIKAAVYGVALMLSNKYEDEQTSYSSSMKADA